MIKIYILIQVLAIIICFVECLTTTSHSTRRIHKTATTALFVRSELEKLDSELEKLDNCRTRTEAEKILKAALSDEEDSTRLFASVKIPKQMSTRRISDAELALQTRTINSKYKITDLIEQNGDRDIDRSSLAVLCVFIFGSTSAIAAQSLPDSMGIYRWLLVFALCFSPLILVGYGLVVPEQLSATLIQIQRKLFPSYRKRMLQHEAGHFLVGYLLGWPVKSFEVKNSVRNAVEFYPLGDADAGPSRAKVLGFDVRKNSNEEDVQQGSSMSEESDKPYYSKDGLGGSEMERSVFRDENDSAETYFALAQQDDPTTSWPFRGFDEETLDILAVISLAGACAEILSFGNAEGGVADLLQLRRIYGAAANSALKSESDNDDTQLGTFTDDAKKRRLRRENEKGKSVGMDEREMDNRTRFALGFCLGLLRQNLGALDSLAAAMERNEKLSGCILALEECPNTSGYTLTGDYDKIRRERFRSEQRGVGAWVEKTFLGGSVTIDVEDSSVIEGKGGGERAKGFQLQGDDVLYAALAVSFAFFAWASNYLTL